MGRLRSIIGGDIQFKPRMSEAKREEVTPTRQGAVMNTVPLRCADLSAVQVWRPSIFVMRSVVHHGVLQK